MSTGGADGGYWAGGLSVVSVLVGLGGVVGGYTGSVGSVIVRSRRPYYSVERRFLISGRKGMRAVGFPLLRRCNGNCRVKRSVTRFEGKGTCIVIGVGAKGLLGVSSGGKGLLIRSGTVSFRDVRRRLRRKCGISSGRISF